jgi:hypothetical protein
MFDRNMNPTLMLCIPGPWKDRTDFLTRVVKETKGEFMFAGIILAQPSRKRHVTLEFCGRFSDLRRAFEFAGQGKLSEDFLCTVDGHQSIAYLHFEVSFIQERDKIIDFTRLMQRVGGFGVKVESAGVAHQWSHWFEQITSENPFDWYRTFVVLVGDERYYYSCGMHHFCLSDVEVARQPEISEAANLMNRFNYWQIVEEPQIDSGHTFSITAEAPHFRLRRVPDSRHPEGDLFHNTSGLWRLEEVEPGASPSASSQHR